MKRTATSLAAPKQKRLRRRKPRSRRPKIGEIVAYLGGSPSLRTAGHVEVVAECKGGRWAIRAQDAAGNILRRVVAGKSLCLSQLTLFG